MHSSDFAPLSHVRRGERSNTGVHLQVQPATASTSMWLSRSRLSLHFQLPDPYCRTATRYCPLASTAIMHTNVVSWSVTAAVAISCSPPSYSIHPSARPSFRPSQRIRRERHRAVDIVSVLSTAAAVDPHRLEWSVLAHQHLHDRAAAEGEERSCQHRRRP